MVKKIHYICKYTLNNDISDEKTQFISIYNITDKEMLNPDEVD